MDTYSKSEFIYYLFTINRYIYNNYLNICDVCLQSYKTEGL